MRFSRWFAPAVLVFALAQVGGTAYADEIANDVPLVGTTWILQDITDEADEADDPDVGKELPTVGAYVRFTDDGKVQGRGGCNGFWGDAEIEDDSIRFGALGWTLMACEDERLGDIDEGMAEVLQDRVVYDITGDRLRISKGRDALILMAVH